MVANHSDKKCNNTILGSKDISFNVKAGVCSNGCTSVR
jgi:hypothetical protein